MNSIEKEATMFANCVKREIFANDPDGSKKQIAGNMKFEGFMLGATWMIDEAIKWLRNNKEELGISWNDNFELNFIKAMEGEDM